MHICHYMCMEPVTGFNLLNKFLRPLRIPVNVHSPILKPFMKVIIGRQLNMLFRSLKDKDAQMAFSNIDAWTEEEQDAYCFKRGININ